MFLLAGHDTSPPHTLTSMISTNCVKRSSASGKKSDMAVPPPILAAPTQLMKARLYAQDFRVHHACHQCHIDRMSAFCNVTLVTVRVNPRLCTCIVTAKSENRNICFESSVRVVWLNTASCGRMKFQGDIDLPDILPDERGGCLSCADRLRRW